MNVFVATYEPYHDNSILVGVRATLEEAKALFPEVEPQRLWNDGTLMPGEYRDMVFAQYTTTSHPHRDVAQIVEVKVP